MRRVSSPQVSFLLLNTIIPTSGDVKSSREGRWGRTATIVIGYN